MPECNPPCCPCSEAELKARFTRDARGRKLEIGDTVTLRGVIVQLNEDVESWNVTVLPENGQERVDDTVTLHARQLIQMDKEDTHIT